MPPTFQEHILDDHQDELLRFIFLKVNCPDTAQDTYVRATPIIPKKIAVTQTEYKVSIDFPLHVCRNGVGNELTINHFAEIGKGLRPSTQDSAADMCSPNALTLAECLRSGGLTRWIGD